MAQHPFRHQGQIHKADFAAGNVQVILGGFLSYAELLSDLFHFRTIGPQADNLLLSFAQRFPEDVHGPFLIATAPAATDGGVRTVLDGPDSPQKFEAVR